MSVGCDGGGWALALAVAVGVGPPAGGLVVGGSVGGLMGWVGGGWVLLGEAILTGEELRRRCS